MSDVIPYVSRLLIHPIKALDGVEVEKVTLLKSGALQQDREFAIFDESGKFVNGKRNDRVHALRSRFDFETRTVSLSVQDSNKTTFHLEKERSELESWLAQHFGFPIKIQQNLDVGFPDDTASPGPTIISTATLEAITSWYPELTVEEVRLRFRTNIEISGVPAFWEDRLFSQAGEAAKFKVGSVEFLGVNPCQRCVVITRNPQTGEAYPNFQKIFIEKRRETLPEWTERSRFNHFYRLAINTQVPTSEAGKIISIGDQVELYNQ